MIIWPLAAATATSGAGVTAHELPLPKNLRPQLTVVSVIGTTWLSAAVTWFQREFAPQLRMQDASAFHSIDPDRSRRIKMSGGCGVAPWLTEAQFMSGLDVPFASVPDEASKVSVGTLPIVPAWPAAPGPAPASARPAPPAPPAPALPCSEYAPSWNLQPASAITTAAVTRNVTTKRETAVDRPISNLQEVNVLRNLTGTLIVRPRADLVNDAAENVSPRNVSRVGPQPALLDGFVYPRRASQARRQKTAATPRLASRL